MKKLIAMLMITLTFSNAANAACDFSTGISKNADGTYTYSKDCHVAVGQMKYDLEAANKQVDDYKRVIELKDLALTKSNERADLWMEASFKLQDRMNTIDDMKSKNQWLMFGLGVLTTGLAVWGAGQLVRR